MLGRALRWLTGGRAGSATDAAERPRDGDADPAAGARAGKLRSPRFGPSRAAAPDPRGAGEAARDAGGMLQGSASVGMATGEGTAGTARSSSAPGPVFSSRAVRDAAVVTAALEALRRFLDGRETQDELVFRLRNLSAEQLGFLRGAVDPDLLEACAQRLEPVRGAPATALRSLLAELSGHVAADRQVSAGASPGSEPVPPAPLLDPVLPEPPPLRPLENDGALPDPPPPGKPDGRTGDLPRLRRTDAEARRAHLLETMSRHLSANEAAR